jgi:hypothetical protein
MFVQASRGAFRTRLRFATYNASSVAIFEFARKKFVVEVGFCEMDRCTSQAAHSGRIN